MTWDKVFTVVALAFVASCGSVGCAEPQESRCEEDIKRAVTTMNKAFSNRDVEELASVFWPAIARGIRAHPEVMEIGREKCDSIVYHPVSFQRIGAACYVTVREVFTAKSGVDSSDATDSEDLDTYVFTQDADGTWRLLDHFSAENAFLLPTLWQDSKKLLRDYRQRKIPWSLEALRAASKDYGQLAERVNDAVLSSPESAFGANDWHELLEARQIELHALANVLSDRAAETTDDKAKTEALREASLAWCLTAEVLVARARPAILLLQVHREREKILMEMELHPMISLTTLAEARQLGLDPSALKGEPKEMRIHYVTCEQFSLMHSNGETAVGEDLKWPGEAEVPTTFLTAKKGELLSTDTEAPLRVTLRFPRGPQGAIPYAVSSGRFRALLIRPPSEDGREGE